MNPADVRFQTLQLLQLALLGAKLTKTDKDDRVAALLLDVILNDELFGKLLEIFSKAGSK